MALLLMVIIGTAAGYVATRIMGVEMALAPTIAVGILGALVGSVIIRLILTTMGLLGGFVGAVIGAILVLWLYQAYVQRK